MQSGARPSDHTCQRLKVKLSSVFGTGGKLRDARGGGKAAKKKLKRVLSVVDNSATLLKVGLKKK